jgi:hypothetical protein
VFYRGGQHDAAETAETAAGNLCLNAWACVMTYNPHPLCGYCCCCRMGRPRCTEQP